MPEFTGDKLLTRARQHLLVQGFTLYTAEAAVCMLLAGSTTFANPDHAWAVEFAPDSWRQTDRLVGIEPQALVQLLSASAELCRTEGRTGALMCTQGTSLLLPLHPADLAGARMRIEAAIMLGKQPPTEKLEAFGDEQLLREARRRKLVPKAEPEALSEREVS